jgi:hypothetical protein
MCMISIAFATSFGMDCEVYRDLKTSRSRSHNLLSKDGAQATWKGKDLLLVG